jgi:outer membrane protein assembly factor BamB
MINKCLEFCQAVAAWAVVLALIIAADTAHADENWSRFRGPNGSGMAPNVRFPAVWSDGDYAWKINLSGKGHSSPVGWGDRLFVTSGDAETGDTTLTALDAATGDELWTERYKSTPRKQHAANSYASSSPTVDDSRVYVTWALPNSLQIAALNHDGKEIWRRELGSINYRHGVGGSPMLIDDLVVVANDNSGESMITALDASTGEPRWRKSRSPGTESYATPAVWEADDGSHQIIVHSTAEGMAGLSPADGAVLWQLKDVFAARCVSSPLVAGGLVFGGSGEGGNGKSFAAVKPAAKGDKATVVYRLQKSLPQVPTPVASGDLLFVWSDKGVVSCYDLATGAPHWSERVGGNYYGSPIIAGDKLYCIASSGEAVVVAADKEFKLLGRNQLGEASSATPVVHGDKMYLRTETALACLPAE